ncbi:MAG TPA: hypothetical protein VHQ90_09010 [Thermoanaerobaculia bacterium]|nr:hypothetical protein [Thermoanaerobaculia bacterium]
MTIKRSLVLGSVLALLLMLGAPPATEAAKEGKTKCDLTFSLSEWAAVVQRAHGTGEITCDNGQHASVRLTSKGGGLTAGKFRIEGKGEFTPVRSINDLYGSYAAAEANAGAHKTGETTVLTKGKVSLAIAGKGEGWNVGVSFGKFTISKVK